MKTLCLYLGIVASAPAAPFQASGIKIGEVSETSAIVWTRCTAVASPDSTSSSSAAPGMDGEIRVTRTPEGGSPVSTSWTPVDASKDFTWQFTLINLSPATTYSLAVESRPSGGGSITSTLSGSFRTAPSADSIAPVTAAIVTCQGMDSEDDPIEGHKVYGDLDVLRPDWFAHTGDVLYYDRNNNHPFSKNVTEARQRWNRMFAYNKNRSFHLNTPSYFLKDDHDTVKNDCWPGQSFFNLTFAEGLAIFKEQTPSGSLPYRTQRWGRDLQAWFLEGRDYRSANTAPDGPSKTILGQAQKDWLVSTLAASDATFKLIVSPTPIVGPDKPGKSDNHANDSFKTEGDWLRAQLASVDNCYVVCGDRHWQYGSIDPSTGLREYGCGPINAEHASFGGNVGYNPEIHTFFSGRGGYLLVRTERVGHRPQIRFCWYDIDVTDPETGLATLAYEETIRDEDYTEFAFSHDHVADTVTFRFMTEVGFSYAIEESSDLAHTDPWTEAVSDLPYSPNPNPGPTNPISLGSLFTHTINVPPSAKRRFFRLQRESYVEPGPYETPRGTLVDVDSWYYAKEGVFNAVLANETTSSPKFGNASSNSNNCTGAQFGGTWGSSINLEIGETVTATGSLSYIDDSVNKGPYVRFGLIQRILEDPDDVTDEAALGGFNILPLMTGVTNDGAAFYESRTDGSWLSTGGNASLFTTVTDSTTTGTWNGNGSGSTYNWSFSITRTGAGSADASFNISDGAAFVLDSTASTIGLDADDFTLLDTVAILFGNNSTLDYAELGNVQVEVESAPSAP